VGEAGDMGEGGSRMVRNCGCQTHDAMVALHQATWRVQGATPHTWHSFAQ
jgi:hypothetical protein